jgi:CelD/BcsL family acetyltransferase involved in cellulose biosynthesis
MITIEKIEDLERFAGIRDEWNELLGDSDSDCVFLTWEWLYTWWKHLAEERQLHILVARCSGRLVGIAPLAWRSSCWRRLLPFPALEFIGAGSAGSDYLDFIIRRGEERQTLIAMADYLTNCKLMLEFSRVDGALSQAGQFTVEAMRNGWTVTKLVTDICPFIDLSGYTWDAYLAGLGASHRGNVRRRLRNLEKEWYTDFAQVQCEEMRAVALQLLVELHRRRWHERGGPGAFNTPALLGFHEDFSRLAFKKGWLRLFVLRLNGKPAAALYGFNYHHTFYFYQSGFDPEFRRHSVGLAIMGLAIRHAIGDKARIFDCLRGNEPYKFLWAHDRRELIRLELFPKTRAGYLYRQIVKLRCGIRKMNLTELPGLS